MTINQAPDRRVRLEADDRRERMIESAQVIFAARPYDSVSTEELARAAGTTRTNLNYHFGNKRNLYLEVLRRFAALPSRLPHGTTRPDVCPADAARTLFTRWLNLVEENRATFIALMRAQRSADEEIAALLRGSLTSWEDRILAVTKMPPSEASRARIRAFQGMISNATSEWLEHGTLSKDEVLELLVRGLVALAD
ncbi:TetR/AcrR family transcriptional regulator [Rhodococcus sp. DMU1]|uniref:TetR/AcrR family transcriptional regulator n=1 Tax=Rhodococcus sp. DMU1 TaxID=2722825 RepID=UPI00143EC504|nr:TetR/AcrR family transcriptional regulator [Rhodococcus sp. DMU1]QIX53542.1 TetR/AcrR family transcriptional regulator [Rhodococcus sp. DMU1]